MVGLGRSVASSLDATIVAIGRNAMPHLENTLELIDEAQRGFKSCRFFCYENDSEDNTAAVLDKFAETRPWATIQHDRLGGADTRGFDSDRTVRLAKCRNVCHEWVKANAASTAWTIVLDLDAHHGFSVDGIFNSIGWLGRLTPVPAIFSPGAMASYSLLILENDEGMAEIAQYDAWAARLNWWEDRRESIGMSWFHSLLPPMGSRPFPMNSAFGGLCVYKTAAFLCGGYSGEDCEHVPHHKRMQESGWQLYFNPGCMYVAAILDS
jgi:hypothetical protein